MPQVVSHQDRRGFVLLELMVVLSIVSASLIMLFQSFSLIAQVHATIAHYTKAMLLTEARLFELEISEGRLPKEEKPLYPPFDQFSSVMVSGPLGEGGLQPVDLAVSWPEQSRRREIRLNTVMRRSREIRP